MIRQWVFGAALLCGFSVPAAAMLAPSEYKAVGDQKSVVLDPAKSYLIVQTSSDSGMFSFPVTFIRLPDEADLEDYRQRRAEALKKARDKWVKKQASLPQAIENWRRAGSKPSQRPVDTPEPTDASLDFPAIDQENLVIVGPFDRFAKAGGKSTFVHMMRPGRYAFYGPVNFAQAVAGTCMCMGTIEFELKPGQITYAGTMRINLLDQRTKAKAAGKPLPQTELDLPETMNSISWEVPEAGATIDPRLSAYTIMPADLRASRRFPNYYGVGIDRLTPIQGVLDYDRDRIVDLKATASQASPTVGSQ